MDFESSSESMPPKANTIGQQFGWLRRIIFQPGQAYSSIIAEERKKTWIFPILVVSILIIFASLISTLLTASSTQSSPARAAELIQTIQATRGAADNNRQQGRTQTQNNQQPGGLPGGLPGGVPGGGFPGLGAVNTTPTATSNTASAQSNIWLSLLWPVVSFLITWLLAGGLTNLFSLAFGGGSHALMALNIAAWSFIPMGARNLMQIIYYLASGTAIQAPGLSGFVVNPSNNAGLVFLQFLLARVDIYLFWQFALLVIGVSIWGGLSRKKALVIALLVLVLVILLQSLVGLGVNLLGNFNLNTNMLLRLR